MTHEWHYLTDLTGAREFSVTQVRIKDTGISIEGDFELPPLAGLRYEDQVFVSEFIRSHGSIKQVEKAFGISYPTVKNRLNRIAAALQLVTIDVPEPPSAETGAVLNLLNTGEITPAEAAERLRG